jgi:rhamnosyltransferase
MHSRDADFWGLTIFPEITPLKYAMASNFPNGIIKQHIQSFFMVFTRPVFSSTAFQSFWHTVEDEEKLLDVVIKYESELTHYLSEAGFTYDAFCRHHEAMQSNGPHDFYYNAIYNQPLEMLHLGCPVIKNKFSAMWEGQVAMIKEYIQQTSSYPDEISSRWH